MRIFKRDVYCFIFLTAAVFIQITDFTACMADITTMPIEILLSRSSVTLSPGESITLTADVYPDEASNKAIVWRSSNPSVAEVNNGVIIALEEGMASISATSISGKITASCLLTVAYHNNPINNRSINIYYNPGSSACNTSIATSKGWRITNSN